MEYQEDIWDAIAPEWAQYRTETSKEVYTFLEGKKGALLDAGCGSGRNFPKQWNGTIIGTDFSSKMIAEAKKRTKQLHIPVMLHKATLTAIPIMNETIDVLLCYSVLHCIEKKQHRQALQELYRVMKQGGTGLISVWGIQSPALQHKKKETTINWTNKKGTKIPRKTYIFDLQELKNLCEQTGFTVLDSGEDHNVWVRIKKA